MRWKAAVWAALVPILAGAAWAPADDEFDAMKKEYEQAQAKFWEQAQGATDPATQPADPSIAFLPRFKAYAEKHAGKPEALPALLMVIQVTPPVFPPSDKPTDAKWAVQQLAEKHAAQPQIKEILPQLRWAGWAVGMETLTPLYERVRKENPDKDAQAAAMFNLAIGLYEMSSAQMPPEMGAAKTDAQREGERKRAEELFRAIVKDYAGSDSAASAAGYVFELDHLQIGMKAPEIVGTGVDEKEIKLSDFRGRVVVIDFWGFW